VPVPFLLVEFEIGEIVARLRMDAQKKVSGSRWVRSGRREAIVVIEVSGIEVDGETGENGSRM